MIVNESIRAAHNDGIIFNASTSIRQEEMNGDQPSTQPCSANPVDTRRNNNGMIVNKSISVQQEESIVHQETVQPCSAIQHCQNESPNINPQEWKEQQTIMTFTSVHPLAFSRRKGLLLNQTKNNFPRMMICISVKP